MSWLTPYIRYLEYAVIVLVFIAGYKTCDILDQAAKTAQIEQVVQVIPQLITKTQTITKVVHDSKDACSRTAIPAPILEQLHKQ